MTAITHHDIDDVWVPQSTFTVGGTPTDPTSLIVRIRNPAGTITTITENTPAAPTLPIVRVSAGVFKHQGIALDTIGHWYVNFKGTGAVAAAEEHEAIVDPSAFSVDFGLSARALVTLAEAKDWLQHANIDTSEDLELVRVVNDVSDRLHEEAGREFKVYGTNPQTRLFDVDIEGVMNRTVSVGDLTSFTTVLVVDKDGTTVETAAAADIVSLPRNRPPWEPIRQLRFTSDVGSLRWEYAVSVAGTWGFPAVPGNIRQACLDAVAATLDRDVEHYRQDLAPGRDEAGAGAIVLSPKPLFLSLPPAVLAVAWGYRDLMVA